MRTPNPERVALALARLAESKRDLDEAAAAHHKAVQACVKVGCQQSAMAASIGVSRQAMSQYIARWLLARPTVVDTKPKLF